MNDAWKGFPAPLEVDRGLYYATVNESPEPQKLPAPLEIDRELYANVLLTIKNQAKTSFRPLPR